VIELDDSFDYTNSQFVQRIQKSEVRKCLRNVAVVWLTKLLNNIFRSNKMSDE
jgi:hypothetical protein